MKKFKCIILWIIFLNTSNILFSQNISTDAYEFPVKPGTQDWYKLTNAAERIEACQIPDLLLLNMSTLGLVETCIKYPLIGEITAANNYIQAFNNILNFFNGFQELLARKDAGEKLLYKYKTMSPESYERNKDSIGIIMNVFDYMCIELLLSQDKILSSLNDSARYELLESTISHYKFKRAEFGYGNLSRVTSVNLALQIIKKEDIQYFSVNFASDERYNLFSKNYLFIDVQFLDEVIIHSEEFIKTKIK
jgi:hypothetical protein